MVEEFAELMVDCRCTLGEGILWCPQREVLLWTDIESARLWRYDPTTQRAQHLNLPDRLGSFGLCESGQLLLGLAKGLFLAEPDWEANALPVLSLLTSVEADEPRTRINDGRCDRAGNFVFGTLNEDTDREPIGGFYQFSSQGLRRLDQSGVAIPNSICFSPDGATLYYCDSMQPRILCCDYDAASARVSNARVFATLPHPGSCADGSIIDAEGCLWNAQWGASRVVRYTPRGEIDRAVRIPAKNPSCVALGGSRLNELVITTARYGLDNEDLERLPESGGIYRCITQIQGLPESTVRFL